MDKALEKFVSYTHQLDYADLTPSAIHAAKRTVVDAIGCALGAFHAPPMMALRNLASRVSSSQGATLIGTTTKSSPDLSGLVNGSMIRYADFSDDYFFSAHGGGPHPSDNMGSILAAAESVNADGKALILGIATAYEACGQTMDAITIGGPLRTRGWDYTIVHSVATALGTAKVHGLNPQQMQNALALAIVPNIALEQTRQGELSNWKGIAGPNGSRNGYFATMLAQAGITGPAEPFEGKAGVIKQLTGGAFELGAFGGKGVPFKVEHTFFKAYPIVYSAQVVIPAVLELRSKINVEDIESVCIYVIDRYAYTRNDRPSYWDPRTKETADHSGPYLAGAALIDGEITHRTLTPERYRDPAILSMVQKISFAEDKQFTAVFPGTFNCRVEAKLKSGKVVTAHQINPKGHPANPMSDQEIEKKFLGQVEGILPRNQAQTLLDQFWGLDKVDSVSKLFAPMVVPG